MKKNLGSFPERLEEGKIGEWIVKLAFELGIIPCGDPTKIEQPEVDSSDENSIKINLVNGDLRFPDFGMVQRMVDVKDGDFISARSLNALAEGNYVFFNAYPDERKRVGRPFMLKLDDKVKLWIRSRCEQRIDENGYPYYRVLKWRLEPYFDSSYFWDFSEDEFCKHRTAMLIQKGKLNV